MPLSSKSPATRSALLYITIGAIVIVWTLIWMVYLYNHPPHSSTTYYICAGFLCTGIIVLLIGKSMGSIGRSARDAETPNVVMMPAPTAQPQVAVPPQPPPPVASLLVDATGARIAPTTPQVPSSADATNPRAAGVSTVGQVQPQR